MPARASPYGFGLYAALLYHQDKHRDFTHHIFIAFEWLALLASLGISALSADGPAAGDTEGWSVGVSIVYTTCIARQLFGLALAYLLL